MHKSCICGAHKVDQEAAGVYGNLCNIIWCFISHPVDSHLLDESLLGELRSLCTLVEKNSKGVSWSTSSMTFCEVITDLIEIIKISYVCNFYMHEDSIIFLPCNSTAHAHATEIL